MKHTPGPWEAACLHAAYRQGEEWSEHENLQWEVYGPREPSGIGDFYQADARLIAAAPELLEALKAIEDHHNETEGWREIARAAIAKAEGA